MQKQFTVTPDQLETFRQEAAKAGLVIPPGNTGDVTTHGVTMTFSYDGTTLTLTITSKPFFIPASMVWGELAPYLPTA